MADGSEVAIRLKKPDAEETAGEDGARTTPSSPGPEHMIHGMSFLVYVLADEYTCEHERIGPTVFRMPVRLSPSQSRFCDDVRRRFRPGSEELTAASLEFAYLNGELLDPTDPIDLETLRVYVRCELTAGRPLVCIKARVVNDEWPDLGGLGEVHDLAATPSSADVPTSVVESLVIRDRPRKAVHAHSTGQQGMTLWQRHKQFILPPSNLDGTPSDYWPWISVDHPMNQFLEVFSLVVTIVSVIVFCIETLPKYRLNDDGSERQHKPFQAIEASCVAFFSAEYLWRLFFATDKVVFVKGWLNVVDLIAVLPFYIFLILEASGDAGGVTNSLVIVRILRLSRVSRLARVSRHSNNLQDVARCMVATRNELALFFLMTSVAMILFGSAIFFCEKDEPETNFVSIPAGFWWAIVTMSTVGYGDIVPVTPQGRVVGGLCATIGVILLAIPAGIFISEFLRLHEQRREQRAAKNRQGDPVAQLKRQLTAAYELVHLMKIVPDTGVLEGMHNFNADQGATPVEDVDTDEGACITLLDDLATRQPSPRVTITAI